MKLYATDLPAVIKTVAYEIRRAVRDLCDQNVLIVEMPETIDFQAEIIIRKDDLTRLELSSRDATITTTTAGTSTETEVKTGATSVTDETESMLYSRSGTEGGTDTGDESGRQDGTQSGTENGLESGGEGGTESGTQGGLETSSESGGESGGQIGGQAGGESQSGGELETYAYESDS